MNIFKLINDRKADKEKIDELNKQVTSLKGLLSLSNLDMEQYESKILYQDCKIRELIQELEDIKLFLTLIKQEGIIDKNTSASITCKIIELTAAIERGYYQM